MFRYLSLILAVLIASSAQGQTEIFLDLPPVGDSVALLSWGLDPDPGRDFDILFNDNKTLVDGPGQLIFLGDGQVFGADYTGALLDASGSLIPGTEYFGSLDTGASNVDLSESTSWSGMRFNFIGDQIQGGYGLAFLSEPNPTVGLVPEPSSLAILSLGLAGFGLVSRRRRSR